MSPGLARRELSVLGCLGLAFSCAVFDAGPAEGLLPWATTSTLLLVGLVFVVCGYTPHRRIEWSSLHPVMLAYGGLLVLNYFTSTVTENTMLFAAAFWSLAAGFWLTSLLTEGATDRLLTYLGWIGGFSALWGAAEFVVTLDRTGGPIIDPNTWAAMCNLLLLGTVAVSVRNGRMGVAQCLLLYLFAFAVAASYSRLGGFILLVATGFLVTLALLLSELRRMSLAIVISIVAAFATVEGMLVLNETQVRERTSVGSADTGWRERGCMWRAGLKAAADHPLGTGLGTFRAHYPAYRDTREYRTVGNYVHNDYIQIAAEGGWLLAALTVGLVTFLGMKLALRTLQFWKHRQGSALVPICFMVSIGSVLVHALMNFPLYHLPNLLLIGVLLAALVRAEGMTRTISLPTVRPVVLRVGALAPALLVGVSIWADVLTDHIVPRNQGPVARFFQATEERYFDTVRALRAVRPGNATNHFALATLYRRSSDRIQNPRDAEVLAGAAALQYLSGLDRNPFHFAVAGYLADLLVQNPGLDTRLGLDRPLEILRSAAVRARTSMRAHLLFARHLPDDDQYSYLVEHALPWLDVRAELVRGDRLVIIRLLGKGAVKRGERAVLERILASLVEEQRFHAWKMGERARRSTQCVGSWRATLGC